MPVPGLPVQASEAGGGIYSCPSIVVLRRHKKKLVQVY